MILEYGLFIMVLVMACGVIIYLWRKNRELETRLERKPDVPPKTPINWKETFNTVLDASNPDNNNLYRDVLVLDEEFNYYWRVTEVRFINDRPVLIMESL